MTKMLRCSNVGDIFYVAKQLPAFMTRRNIKEQIQSKISCHYYMLHCHSSYYQLFVLQENIINGNTSVEEEDLTIFHPQTRNYRQYIIANKGRISLSHGRNTLLCVQQNVVSHELYTQTIQIKSTCFIYVFMHVNMCLCVYNNVCIKKKGI